MPGMRVQFDDETWQAIEAVADDTGKAFQELAEEAFADLLKKHKQPVGLKASLKESIGERQPARGAQAMSDFSHEEQAKRLYGLDEMEAEALEVLRLIVRQTARGENLDADLVERAKAIVERYDNAMMRGHEAPGVVPFKRS